MNDKPLGKAASRRFTIPATAARANTKGCGTGPYDYVPDLLPLAYTPPGPW